MVDLAALVVPSGDRQGLNEHRLGFLWAPDHVENPEQVMPNEEVFRISLKLTAEQRQVAVKLPALVTVVADVLDEQRCRFDRAPVPLSHLLDRREVGLMDDPLEANVGIIPPDSVLEIGRALEPRPQLETERYHARIGEQRLDLGPIRFDEPLVGVDVEDPIAPRPIDAALRASEKSSFHR